MEYDESTILDILNAARLAVEFVEGLNNKTFLSDAKSQSAVLHQLTIIGEAVKRLSAEFRDRHADLPWRLMAGMRDVLIHQYHSVDFDVVWQTVSCDLPTVIVALELIAPSNDNG